MDRCYMYNKYYVNKLTTLSLYQKSFINNIKNKLCMKAIIYACFKLEEKSLEVLKRIKAILSTI